MIHKTTPNGLLAIFATILFLVAPMLSFSQSATPKKTAISLVSDNGEATVMKFDAGAMGQKTVSTPAGEALVITMDDGTPILKKGFPDLPKLTASIIIPDEKNMQVRLSGAAHVPSH